jgi:uncharacterized protein YebE (UPF0316 family)
MEWDWTVYAIAAAIFLARILDVGLGTLRSVCVINGRRTAAWFLGFFEVLVWVIAVSKVITHVTEAPIYAVAFALGAATGNWVGITVERHIAYGQQIVRVFTRLGAEVADALREAGFRVTEIDGRGRNGPVELLFIECRRREAMDVAQLAREMDPQCYFIVDDIRMTSAAYVRHFQPTGWRAITKTK